MDEASRVLIEQMVAEEQNYESRAAEQLRNQSLEMYYLIYKTSSAHRKWTVHESDILKEAMRFYGKDYAMISQHLAGSRTALQVKNRISHMIKYGLLKNDDSNVYDNRSDIALDPLKDEPLADSTRYLKRDRSSSPKSADEELEIDSDSKDDMTASTIQIPSYVLELRDLTPIPASPEPPSISSSSEDSEADIAKEIKFDTSLELSFEKNTIHPLEIEQNAGFFTGATTPKFKNKTPARYLRIRNHILDLWELRRPDYITKTSARKGLIGQGDVNAIARVWEFLATVGAINKGSVYSSAGASRQPRKQRDYYKETTCSAVGEKKIATDILLSSIISDEKRSRRVKDEHGNWVNEKDLEGRVIDHEKLESQTLYEKAKLSELLSSNHSQALARKKSRKEHHNQSDFYGLDPFQLIPEIERHKVPFSVTILSSAKLLIDFHAHLAHTEVIGLLGGVYAKGVLQIRVAYPCKSTSTQVQCEMDPESEMKARTDFAELGFDVVGWYHSHPTFITCPSIRDIENQSAYQGLFRRDDGIEPFIGAIVNPYPPAEEFVGRSAERMKSRFSFLGIGEEWGPQREYRKFIQAANH